MDRQKCLKNRLSRRSQLDGLRLLSFELTKPLRVPIERSSAEFVGLVSEFVGIGRTNEMEKRVQRLSAMAVMRATKPGLYPDGAGLYLRIGRNGSKSWAFRFMLNGNAREMGFGGLTKVGLADARKKATDARLLLSEGRDPRANIPNRKASTRMDDCRHLGRHNPIRAKPPLYVHQARFS